MDVDRTRFEELFNRHYGAVMRYAARRLGPEQAPDVVSETFLVAWRRLAEVPTADPLPWLYATARNVIGNELRGRSRRARLEARIGDAADLVEQDHADLVIDQVRVRRALAGLSERDQEALRLASWEGLDVGEAATVMGCSRAAYRVRLHRARKRLAAALDAQPHWERSGSALFPLVPEGGSQ
jgi:RNA polymerase sigma-70 factor (ECF subfamily)